MGRLVVSFDDEQSPEGEPPAPTYAAPVGRLPPRPYAQPSPSSRPWARPVSATIDALTLLPFWGLALAGLVFAAPTIGCELVGGDYAGDGFCQLPATAPSGATGGVLANAAVLLTGLVMLAVARLLGGTVITAVGRATSPLPGMTLGRRATGLMLVRRRGGHVVPTSAGRQWLRDALLPALAIALAPLALPAAALAWLRGRTLTGCLSRTSIAAVPPPFRHGSP